MTPQAPPIQQQFVAPSTAGVLVFRTVLAALLIAGMAQSLLTRDDWFLGFGGRPDLVASGMRIEVYGLATLLCLGLLIFGPQPRWATKWAWFWLTLAVGPLWLAFVLFEPVPLWIKHPLPAVKRFTGGWSFLLSVFVLGPLAAALLPGWVDLL